MSWKKWFILISGLHISWLVYARSLDLVHLLKILRGYQVTWNYIYNIRYKLDDRRQKKQLWLFLLKRYIDEWLKKRQNAQMNAHSRRLEIRVEFASIHCHTILLIDCMQATTSHLRPPRLAMATAFIVQIVITRGSRMSATIPSLT